MKTSCENIRNNWADLFDRDASPEQIAAIQAHLDTCPACKKYVEDMQTAVAYLTPRVKPQAMTAAPVTPQRVGFARRLLRAAAVVAIFLLGVGTGLSHFFSVSTHAEQVSTRLHEAIGSVRNVGSFRIGLEVCTTPKENFAYIDPACSFVPVTVEALRVADTLLFRVEKAGGRVVTFDGRRQRMWINGEGLLHVEGPAGAAFLEDFKEFLTPERMLSFGQKLASAKGVASSVGETADSITISISQRVLTRDITVLAAGKQNSVELTMVTQFSRADGLLRSIRVSVDGVDVVRSTGIVYNQPVDRAALLKTDDLPFRAVDEAPAVSSDNRLKQLQQESATEAARRVVTALIAGRPADAGEALSYYGTGDMEKLVKAFRGCHASGFSAPKRLQGYASLFVYYKLTKPDGSTQKRHISLRRHEVSGVWMADGGL